MKKNVSSQEIRQSAEADFMGGLFMTALLLICILLGIVLYEEPGGGFSAKDLGLLVTIMLGGLSAFGAPLALADSAGKFWRAAYMEKKAANAT